MTQITSGRMKLAEYARNVHVAVAPQGVTLEQALKPGFWAHVAQSIKAWDRIELRAEDESWFADLVVYRADRLATYCEVVSALDFSGHKATKSETKQEAVVPDGYDVNYGGPVHKYRVLRSSDSEVLAHGMSKKDAIRWANEHAAQVAGHGSASPVSEAA